MRSLELTLCTAVAAVSVGCPGTIDDPTAFFTDGQLEEDEGGVDAGPAQDAGSPGTDAATADAAPQGSRDAETDTGSAQEDASVDAGSERDAGRDAGADAAGGVSCDFPALMLRSCGESSCHEGPSTASGLDLTSPGLAGRLEGENGSGVCANAPLADPNNPEDSVLYLRVTGASCGVRMPLGAALLSEEDQDCILQWIEQL